VLGAREKSKVETGGKESCFRLRVKIFSLRFTEGGGYGNVTLGVEKGETRRQRITQEGNDQVKEFASQLK
jgi:hypothetical protein